MKISDVKTAFKIADVELIEGSKTLNFNYLEELKNEKGEIIDNDILTKNCARIYLIVVDEEIKKIGGSQCKGGIKQTLSIYRNGGQKGRPSLRSLGIWYFLYNTILEKKKIEFYMIYQDNFDYTIKGLFGFNEVKESYVSYKLLEECCIDDYLEKENGKYPDWNVQEQAGDWPDEVKKIQSELYSESLNRDKLKGRKTIKR
jgi:hypothetical protein